MTKHRDKMTYLDHVDSNVQQVESVDFVRKIFRLLKNKGGIKGCKFHRPIKTFLFYQQCDIINS